MLKCLECQNYNRNGKIHKCRKYPEVTLYLDGFPSEPLKESCGEFEKIRFRTSTTSHNRGAK